VGGNVATLPVDWLSPYPWAPGKCLQASQPTVERPGSFVFQRKENGGGCRGENKGCVNPLVAGKSLSDDSGKRYNRAFIRATGYN